MGSSLSGWAFSPFSWTAAKMEEKIFHSRFEKLPSLILFSPGLQKEGMKTAFVIRIGKQSESVHFGLFKDKDHLAKRLFTTIQNLENLGPAFFLQKGTILMPSRSAHSVLSEDENEVKIAVF